MTGSVDFSRTKAIEMGFDGFLAKPFSMDALSRLIDGRSDNSDNNTAFESLEEMFEGDRQAIVNVLKVFVSATSENIGSLREAIADNDFTKAQALCHKMLPMFMQIGGNANAVDFLKQMDSYRSDGGEKHPFWKGKVSDFIVNAEKMIVEIREAYLV